MTDRCMISAIIQSHLFQFILFAYLIPLGEDFYGAYDAQNFAIENSKALGVTPVPSLNLVYTQEEVQKSFFFYAFFSTIFISII
jgi:hypothetical protein